MGARQGFVVKAGGSPGMICGRSLTTDFLSSRILWPPPGKPHSESAVLPCLKSGYSKLVTLSSAWLPEEHCIGASATEESVEGLGLIRRKEMEKT